MPVTPKMAIMIDSDVAADLAVLCLAYMDRQMVRKDREMEQRMREVTIPSLFTILLALQADADKQTPIDNLA